MRAVQFSEYGPAEVVHVAEAPAPHAGPNRIRIAVRASGVTAGETYLRSGRLREIVPTVFPFVTGVDAAGVVDEIGEGVTGVSLGDEVFGVSATFGGTNADHAVLEAWAPKPAEWSWAEAGGASGNVETSTRVLDRLGTRPGQTVLIHGAAGGVGTVAIQLAVARGATVIGTASAHNHDFLRSLGATPTTYGPGLVDRVRTLAPSGVDAVFDCAGGALPDLVAIAGDPARVVTVADVTAATHGVHLSHVSPDSTALGPADRPAMYGLAIAVALAGEGRLRIPVAGVFPLAEVAAAHSLSESGHARGKIALRH
jgi:NADPH:quinone reductase-like Zn-dependent oxidoreductase